MYICYHLSFLYEPLMDKLDLFFRIATTRYLCAAINGTYEETNLNTNGRKCLVYIHQEQNYIPQDIETFNYGYRNIQLWIFARCIGNKEDFIGKML